MSGFDYGIVVWRGAERMSDTAKANEMKADDPAWEPFWNERETVGRGRVKISLNKIYPFMRLDDKEVSLAPYQVFPHPGEHGADDMFQRGYAGEIAGHRFGIFPYDGRYVAITLVEPDGTVWKATGGYGYGEGWPPYE